MTNRLRTLGLVPFSLWQLTYEWEHWVDTTSKRTLCGFDCLEPDDRARLKSGPVFIKNAWGHAVRMICPDCSRRKAERGL